MIKFFKKQKEKIRVKWKNLKPEQKQSVQDFLNCEITSIAVSMAFFIFMSFWLLPTIKRLILTFSFFLVSLPLVEHYYRWFRRDWQY